MSSSDVVISASGLSKQYRIAHASSRPSTLVDALRTWRPARRTTYETFWALRDASFEVRQGEVVGIIGRNGAGKSTLLKILSRIVKPSNGIARVRGRLGSLLEVGTGFHPELTGRENVFLNGAILGMRAAEVRRHFDAIVDFSGIERFLDTPVKRYSSGMYVRLAFAVAAHLNSDVLIVDEVLAVGDAEFQKKCLDKMHTVGGEGRTVLLVSHNMSAIVALTRRVLVLAGGTIVFDGDTHSGVAAYMEGDRTSALDYRAPPRQDLPTITRAILTTSHPGRTHKHGQPLCMDVVITTPHAIKGARLGFHLVDRFGHPCAHFWLFDSEQPYGRTPGVHTVRCTLPHLRLGPGLYTLKIWLGEYFGGRHFETVENVCPFEVAMFDHPREGVWQPDTFAYIEDVTSIVLPTDSMPEPSAE